MKSILSAITSLVFTLFIAVAPTSPLLASDYPDQKVVYHINYDDPKRIAATFTNIANHINALGEDHISVKAIIHGPAIKYFIEASDDETKQTTIDSLRLNDVHFVICGNSLDGFQVSYEELYEVEAEDVVQAGLPEIIYLQQQGYFYVRP